MKRKFGVSLWIIIGMCGLLFTQGNTTLDFTEKIKNWHTAGAQIEFSRENVKEGKYSLVWKGLPVNKEKGGGPCCFLRDKIADFSVFNIVKFWVYPEVSDGTYEVEVRVVIVEDGKNKWKKIGKFNEITAPCNQWTQLSFDMSEIKRDKVIRPIDFVAWAHNSKHSNGEVLLFYLDGIRFTTEKQTVDTAVSEKKKTVTIQKLVKEKEMDLLQNTSFENGLAHWKQVTSGKDVKIGFDTGIFFEGKQSLKIENPGPEKRIQFEQVVGGIKGGKWYRLNVWMKTKNSYHSDVIIHWYEEGGNTRIRNIPFLYSQMMGTHEGQYYSRVFKVPEKASRAKVCLWASMGKDAGKPGVTWFDSVSLEEEMEAVKNPEPYMLLTSPGKKILREEKTLNLPAKMKWINGVKTLRMVFTPLSKGFTVLLGNGKKNELPFLRYEKEELYRWTGGKWQLIPNAYLPETSTLIYIVLKNKKEGVFMINGNGWGQPPIMGPFELKGELESIEYHYCPIKLF